MTQYKPEEIYELYDDRFSDHSKRTRIRLSLEAAMRLERALERNLATEKLAPLVADVAIAVFGYVGDGVRFEFRDLPPHRMTYGVPSALLTNVARGIATWEPIKALIYLSPHFPDGRSNS